jgi:hypothetical protein
VEVQKNFQRRIIRGDELYLAIGVKLVEVVHVRDAASKVSHTLRVEKPFWKISYIEIRRQGLFQGYFQIFALGFVPMLEGITNGLQPERNRSTVAVFYIDVEIRVSVKGSVEELECCRAGDEHSSARLPVPEVMNFGICKEARQEKVDLECTLSI